MEDLYRLDPAATTSYSSDDILKVGNFSSENYYYTATTSSARDFHSPFCVAGGGGGSMLQFHTAGSSDHMSDLIKAQIANHPRYPNLVSAYIECQKVGAPPETVSFLEEIVRENNTTRSSRTEIGVDPALDEFMESYCEVLHRYKVELSKPFDEATTFFSNIESQLINLCKGELTRTSDYPSDEAAGTSEEDLSYGEVDQAPDSQDSSGAGVGPGDDQDAFKAMLMRKYSGHFSTLKKEFLKKKKKSLLPKDARKTLIDWWNAHYRWPYPTEEEKMGLSEETGLDQKQINNWFINQRKRHWKPSEDMRFAVSDSVKLGANNIN